MFAVRLKELRLERKLTQSDLSKILDVDRTTVMKWESGERETNFTMLVEIADFFDVSLDFLLGRSEY